MSDLISRSELIEEINELLQSPYANQKQFDKERREAIEIVRDLCVKQQSTSYDIDKTVEELESFAKLAEDRWVNGTSKHAYQEHKCWVKAIEIVKQGGVSDDFCEGTQSGDMAISPHTFSKYKIKQCDGLYALSTCPYCGKKIKVVE